MSPGNRARVSDDPGPDVLIEPGTGTTWQPTTVRMGTQRRPPDAARRGGAQREDARARGPTLHRRRVVLRFADIASTRWPAQREEIDALNVYPVPDGDTGTNLFLTVESARDALLEAAERGRPTWATRSPAFAPGRCSAPAATPA